jgi:hypothetical protein
MRDGYYLFEGRIVLVDSEMIFEIAQGQHIDDLEIDAIREENLILSRRKEEE